MKLEELMLIWKLVNFLCYESGLNQCILLFDYYCVLKIYINKQRNLYYNLVYFCEKKMIKIVLDRGYIFCIC